MKMPSPVTRLAALLLLVFTNAPARAGTVEFKVDTQDFDVSVEVRDGPMSASEPLAAGSGTFTYTFDASAFKVSAYARRVFVIEWTPKEADKPALDLKPFVLELPILLRSWRVADKYEIPLSGFKGANNLWLGRYENMTNSGDQWTRAFASLQQAAYLSDAIRPTIPQVSRALNTAVDALSQIALPGSGVYGIEPPLGLSKVLQNALDPSDRRFSILSNALSNMNSMLWRDVPDIGRHLSDASCEVVQGTIEEYEARRRDDPKSYDLQFKPNDTTYQETKELLLKTHCG